MEKIVVGPSCKGAVDLDAPVADNLKSVAKRLDRDVVGMWQRGEWADFCDMLPEYAAKGHGEGFMHDTAMLLGALGWSHYDRGVEIITPYFGSSGTGQLTESPFISIVGDVCASRWTYSWPLRAPISTPSESQFVDAMYCICTACNIFVQLGRVEYRTRIASSRQP